MTITLTLPDDLYQRVLDMAGRHQVSAERLAAAALAEQIALWARIESLSGRGERQRFLAALDRVPAADPAPEDRL